jgi:RES domain-containing protein
MKGVEWFAARLSEIKPVAVRGRWFSMTEFEALCENEPPDWLYTSGEANRFNPPKILCVYFANDERTAKVEYENGSEPSAEPYVTYCAEVQLKRVLDLTNARVLKKLGITRREIFGEWLCDGDFVTQRLGRAVQAHPNFCAIRFPSAAAKEKGFRGENLLVFRGRLKRGESVRILGPRKKTLQKWP